VSLMFVVIRRSLGGCRCLNPDNEVRRLFGSRVVQAEQRFVHLITLIFNNYNNNNNNNNK